MDPYRHYYELQAGGEMVDHKIGPVFRTKHLYQRGYGFGGFFTSLYRYAKPLLVRAAKALGIAALRTSGAIITDLANKKPEDTAANIIKKHVKEKVNKFLGGRVKKTKKLTDPLNKLKRLIKGVKKNRNLKKDPPQDSAVQSTLGRDREKVVSTPVSTKPKDIFTY